MWVDVHLTIFDFGGVGLDVVGPDVEGIPTGKFESGVVPVAGQNPLVDGAFREGKAHVRAAVVDGVDLAVVVEQDDDWLSAETTCRPSSRSDSISVWFVAIRAHTICITGGRCKCSLNRIFVTER